MRYKIRISNRQRLAFFMICAILYKYLLGQVYSYIVNPVFEYSGFINQGTSVTQFVSWAFFLCSLFLWKKIFENDSLISLEILFLLFLISFTPFTVLIGYGIFEKQYIVFNVIYWCVLLILMQLPIKVESGHRLYLKFPFRIDNGRTFLKIIFLAVVCIIIFVSGYYGDFRIDLGLLNVYERRQMASEAGMPTMLSYLMGWAQVLLPICIGIFIKVRQWLWAVSGIFIAVLSFGFDGSKTAFLLILLAVILNFLPNTGLRRLNGGVLLVANSGMVLSIVEYRIWHTFLLASFTIRRVMFVPELLRSNYFDFFAHHTPDYFRGSFLRHFGFRTEYKNLPQMISALYYPDLPVSNANNGLISDAMTNLGYVGIFFMPVLIVVIMKLLERWSDKMYFTVYLSFGTGVAFSLSNSFLFTALMSHGMLAAMLMMHRLNRYRWK